MNYAYATAHAARMAEAMDEANVDEFGEVFNSDGEHDYYEGPDEDDVEEYM